MQKLSTPTLLLALGMLWMGIDAPLRATTIFDNSAHDLGTRFDPGTNEAGDEILLADTARYLTTFSFEYWGVNTTHPTYFDGSIQARVKFYRNTGALVLGYASPSPASFFDSGWFSVPNPTDRLTFDFTAGSDLPSGGLFIPTSDMTWSVQFQGMALSDSVGVDLYTPPLIGDDYTDYWENDSGWMLCTNGVPMDFAALLQANSTVPEPSIITLWICGGLGILTLARRLRRKA